MRRRARQHALPPIFHPFMAPARYKGAWGGRGSAKSHSFAEMLLDRHQQRETRSVCVREHQVSLEQSVKRLLEDKIKQFGLTHFFRVMNNCIEDAKGGIIIFQGMKNHTAQSIKSLEGYDIAWVEEAQSLSQTSLSMLRPTIRKPNSEIWFTWNPSKATDPVDVFLRSTPPHPDAIVVRANYTDNPYFPDVLRKEMEWDQRDPERYAHIWLGEYETKSEARVFKNWQIQEFETPDDMAVYQGADWGFSADPSVMVRCWTTGTVEDKNRTLYVSHEAYQVGCEIDHLAALFDQIPNARAWMTLADSARPETISYLNRYGYPRIEAAKKGPDSVKEGIIFLQGFNIIVHPRCKHTIDELTLYSYKKDPLTGMVMPILEDKKNHVIDSLRYAVERLRQPTEWLTW